MATNYAYNFAIVDRITKMCIEVRTSTLDQSSTADEIYVPVPEYNEDYLFKYYNEADGKFYYDDTFTEEFIPA